MTKNRRTVSERIENAVDIIAFAIKNKVSVKEASVRCGFSDTYVKNIKAMVHQKFDTGELNVNLFNKFQIAHEEYLDKRTTFNRPQRQVEKTSDVVIETNKPKDLPKSGNRETIIQKDNNVTEYEWVANSNYPIDHVKTVEELLAATDVDTEVWKPVSQIVNKWDVTMKVKEGGEYVPKTIQNWQVKARLERDIKVVRERQVGEIFQEMTQNYKPPVYSSKLNNDTIINTENNLLEISIFDLHIGKLAWHGETFENYDVKIASERFLGSIEKLMQNARGFNYERILFPIGNDFFNSDNIFNTTTRGTQQDEDLRWQKTFNVGVQLLVDAIYYMKKVGVPIDVLVIPGNHDFERSYYMGSYLEAWFKDDDEVSIDNGASPRKYYRYGNTLLGLTHGSEEKEASLPMLMATDIQSKPMWSETKFHEWHLGHIHRKRTVQYDINKSRLLNEDLGVTVRYLSSLTGTEEWHHKKGFVGSTKAADGFVWNYEFGLCAHLNTNLILE